MQKQKEEGRYILWFSELSKKDIPLAGGKGANLGEMYNAQIEVPNGFVVTAQAFDYFISKTDLKTKIHEILESVDVDKTAELEEKAKKIREMVVKVEIPKELEKEMLEAYEILGTDYDKTRVKGDALEILRNSHEPIFVAVRSSATTEDLADASFAGQQESFTNVKGEKELIVSVKKCFASLYTARAIFYRMKRGFEHKKSLLAVVIQKMVNSDKSGVMFTSDPVNKEDNIVIEAVFGLGEGIVSGRIKPDHYEVSRELKILEKKISSKKIALVRHSSGKQEEVKLTEVKSKSPVLTNSQILDLANQAIKIEQHYKKTQDIEFAIDSGEIFIVQSRPITTKFVESSEEEFEGKVLLTGLPASPGRGSGKVRIVHSLNDLSKIKEGDVLVTEMTNPDMVLSMQKASAIVTNEGGITAHAAIVSREMGIPAVVGTETATEILKDGMIITVDGSKGRVYEGGSKEIIKKEILPVVETKTKIKVMIDLPDFAERAAKSEVKEVGLIRLEGIIASSGKHPMMFLAEDKLEEYEKLIERGIEKISNHFEGVWIRTSDIRSDEYRNLQGSPKEVEANPMLGFHGIRFSLKNKGLFEAELQAVRNLALKNENKKFGLMFPQVISVEEVKETKKIFEKFKTKNMYFGIMVETPAACMIIKELCEVGIDFISFGTNDLTQYTLAIDRGNENVQYIYNEMNPAVLKEISRVIRTCKEFDVETSICGQAGSNPEMVKYLIEKGINSISVNADMAYEISKLVKSLEENVGKGNLKEEERVEGKDTGVKEYSREMEKGEESERFVKEEESNLPEMGLSHVKETEEGEGAVEFPNIELGFDVFTPQGENKEEEKEQIEKVDDLESIEEKIQDKVEESEEAKEGREEEREKIEEGISIEREDLRDKEEENDEGINEVVDDINEKKDEDDEVLNIF